MFNSIFKNIDDKCNPVMLKELRQSVNGKSFRLLLDLLIVVLFITLYVTLFFINENPFTAGKNLFLIFYLILSIGVLLVIPSLIGTRFFDERKKKTMELLYTSTISPKSIIIGKYLSGVVLTLQFLSICLPFMVICYLMRGIDIFTILTYILIMFILFQPILMFAIFFSTLPISLMLFRGLLFGSCVYLASFIFTLVTSSLTAFSIINIQDLKFIIILSLISTEITLFLFLLALIPISSKPSNRVMPVRIFFLFVFVFNMILCYFFKALNASMIFLSIYYVLSILGILISCSEREEYNYRILKDIPKNFLKRFFFFPFYTGAVNGMTFFSLSSLATILLFFILILNNPKYNTIMEDNFIFTVIAFSGYSFMISLIAFILKKYFFKKYFSRIPTSAYAIILFFLSFFIPLILILITVPVKQYRIENIQVFFIATPIGCIFDNTFKVSLILNSFLTLIALIVFIFYIISAFLKFNRVEDNLLKQTLNDSKNTNE
jgi:hypothetical protein